MVTVLGHCNSVVSFQQGLRGEDVGPLWLTLEETSTVGLGQSAVDAELQMLLIRGERLSKCTAC